MRLPLGQKVRLQIASLVVLASCATSQTASSQANGAQTQADPDQDKLAKVQVYQSASTEPCPSSNSAQGKDLDHENLLPAACLLRQLGASNTLRILDMQHGAAFLPCGWAQNKELVAVSPYFLDPLNWIAGYVVTLVLNGLDDAGQSYLAKFTKSPQATVKSVDLYEAFKPNYPLGTKPATVCIRYTKLKRGKDNGNNTISVDFIGALSYDRNDRAHLTLRPIRLYYVDNSAFTAETEIGSDPLYTVTPQLSVTTASRGVHQIDVNNTAITNAEFGVVKIASAELKSGVGYYHVFTPEDKSNTIPNTRVSLPAWDLEKGDGGAKHTSADMTLTLREVGSPNAVLKILADFVHSTKDTATKDLTSQTQHSLCTTLNHSATPCK